FNSSMTPGLDLSPTPVWDTMSARSTACLRHRLKETPLKIVSCCVTPINVGYLFADDGFKPEVSFSMSRRSQSWASELLKLSARDVK
ncbi:hypothetical protein BgiBS90_014860, partial [Biomphalaria glabrata]